ncbi:ATP synthase B chain [Cutibacterium acnes JCM 18909]|nr:ATP synthase B chain [Cutibacterium acnes JCM 18909]
MNILEMNLGPLAPEHPIEIIVGVILVLLLTWLIAKAVVPRFEKLYEERTETIQGGIERAEKAQAEAKAALEKYQAQLASARDEAAQIRDDAKSQGAQIIAEMRANAQEEADRITERANAQIQAERDQAVREVRAEIGGLATTLPVGSWGSPCKMTSASRRPSTASSHRSPTSPRRLIRGR